MFDQVAPRYEERNRLFSLNRDHAWRRRAARHAALRPGDLALDLCTGTGQLAAELVRFVRPGGRVIGVDFSSGMLELARRRAPEAEFRQGDVSRLSEADGSVDAVTIGFGVRNLVNREAALKEMHRVLGRGKRLVILEFSPPPAGWLMRFYGLYLGRIMPAVAGLTNRDDGNAYRYLADSVRGFVEPAALTRELERLGFSVTVERMSFGIVAIHTAIKRP